MSVADRNRKLWIEKGYEHFALYVPDNLSILKISKEIGLPRTSFYYYFADREDMIEQLLIMHYKTTDLYTAAFKEQCKVLIPD